MTTHTPTPWRVVPDNVDPFYIAAPDKGMTAFVGVVPSPMQTGRDESENRANAEFIVRAVNNHAALEDFALWVECWVSNPVGSYSVAALDGLFEMTRDRLAALASIKDRA